jgi:hypothetical protein
MSHSVSAKWLDDEASAGWTTYGTSRATLSLGLSRFGADYLIRDIALVGALG